MLVKPPLTDVKRISSAAVLGMKLGTNLAIWLETQQD
jgi:hypothetical protein